MFFLMPRTIIVLAIIFGLILMQRLYRQRRRRIEQDRRPTPALPTALVGDADRTWVIFTTPLCAACGPVEERLRRADPLASIVTIDATEHPTLASQQRVRSAPTVLLADRAGAVHARLVGAPAVTQHLAAAQASKRP